MVEPGNFELFGPAHLLTVLVVLTVSIGLPLWVRWGWSQRQGRVLAAGLGIFVVIQESFKIWIRAEVYDYRNSSYSRTPSE